MKKILTQTLFISTMTPALLCISSQSFSESLAEVYQQALTNSDTYKSDIYTYQAAKEALPLAYSELMPQVSYAYAYGTSYENGAQSAQSAQSLSSMSTVSLTQPLFDWSYFNNITLAKASVMSAYASFLSAKQTLIANVINDYLTVLQNQRILSIDESYLADLKIAFESANKTDSGSNTDNRDQIKSISDQVSVTIINDKQLLSQSVENLRTLTHQYYTTLKGPTQLKKVQLLNSEDEWVAVAEKNNLNVVAEQAYLLSANAALRNARGVFLPTVSLSPSYTTTHSPGLPNSSSTGVELEASVPIFSGGSGWITMKEDKYSQQATQKSLDQAIQSAQSTTKKDYVAVKSAISSFNASVKSLASAENSLASAQKGYKEGKYTSYELVTSLAAVVSARESITQALIGYFSDVTQLKLDAGTLKDQDIDSLNKLFLETIHLPKLSYDT